MKLGVFILALVISQFAVAAELMRATDGPYVWGDAEFRNLPSYSPLGMVSIRRIHVDRGVSEDSPAIRDQVDKAFTQARVECESKYLEVQERFREFMESRKLSATELDFACQVEKSRAGYEGNDGTQLTIKAIPRYFFLTK